MRSPAHRLGPLELEGVLADHGMSERGHSRIHVVREANLERSDVATTAAVVLAVLGVLAALHFMKLLLAPVALALLLACLLSPLTSFLRKILPLSSTGAAVVLFLVLGSAGLFLAFLTADSLEEAAETLPAYTERLAGTASRQVHELVRSRPILGHFLPEPGKIDALGDRNRSLLVEALRERLGDMWGWFGEGVIVLVLLVFLLAESEMLTPRVIRFFAPAPGDAHAAERTFRAVVRQIRAYLLTFTLLNLGLGIATAIALRLLGTPFAVALGVGVFTLFASFIPYVGQVASGALVVLVTLSHTGSLGDALLAAAVFVAIAGLTGYVLTPIALGRSLDLNGTTVLIACLFWGFLWGMEGLFLAIPITVGLKLIFQIDPRLHRWAELMSRGWHPPEPVALTAAIVDSADVPLEPPKVAATGRRTA